jgi:hypothetical protein
MSDRCPRCGGEGEVYYDRIADFVTCPECGGEGLVDPYFEDEWYEDDEEWDTDGDYIPTGKEYPSPLPEDAEIEEGFSTHSFD